MDLYQITIACIILKMLYFNSLSNCCVFSSQKPGQLSFLQQKVMLYKIIDCPLIFHKNPPVRLAPVDDWQLSQQFHKIRDISVKGQDHIHNAPNLPLGPACVLSKLCYLDTEVV